MSAAIELRKFLVDTLIILFHVLILVLKECCYTRLFRADAGGSAGATSNDFGDFTSFDQGSAASHAAPSAPQGTKGG